MTHVLKIQERYWKAVNKEDKTFEIRYNDRNYNVEDTIHFVDENGNEFLGDEQNVFVITYIYRGVIGLKDDYVCLAIRKCLPRQLPTSEDRILKGLCDSTYKLLYLMYVSNKETKYKEHIFSCMAELKDLSDKATDELIQDEISKRGNAV